MEKKEFLNEETYQKNKNTIVKIALIVLIVGLLLGGSLIITGLVKTHNAKKTNEQIYNEIDNSNTSRTESQVQTDIDNIESQINVIDTEIDSINTEIKKLQNEKNQIFTQDHGFSDRYYAKENEITEKETERNTKVREKSKLNEKLNEYELELWKIQSGYNDTKNEIEKANNTISSSKYIPFYILGGFIIIASSMISFSIYTFAKRREILAFSTQQVMPIAQEGIEKMAPTIGKSGASIAKEMAPVYGSIAKEISKGIKDGIKETENKKEQ